MKFEQTPVEPVFVPVTITLESQSEVNYFATLLGSTGTSFDRAFGLKEDEAYKLYDKLDRLADKSRPRAESAKLRT